MQTVIDDIAAEMAEITERGVVADYIPDLACISPDRFGIAIAGADGAQYCAGDAGMPFSIQSISKVFNLTMALNAVGDDLWHRVGREASGSAFNSIVQLETECGIPRNPFINAGAIVMCDALLSCCETDELIPDFLMLLRELADDDAIAVDDNVAQGEMETGFRNRALANYMRGFDNVLHPIDETLGVYFQQCSVAMNCLQLARAGRFLMMGGLNPDDGAPIVSDERARRILALMMTCGHYDGSGEFAYRVGLPGKSGVGGGILAIAPGIASIAVWSPGLNERGNSQVGSFALERLVQRTGWSVFEG